MEIFGNQFLHKNDNFTFNMILFKTFKFRMEIFAIQFYIKITIFPFTQYPYINEIYYVET